MLAYDRSKPEPTPQAKRNAKVAMICGAGFVLMVGASFASVPLYKAFCQVTGFGGYTQRADHATGPSARPRSRRTRCWTASC